MNDSMTFAVIVFTAVIAFIVAKLAPAMHKEETQRPQSGQPFRFWRLIQGTMRIRREQVTEEWFEEIPPPKGK